MLYYIKGGVRLLSYKLWNKQEQINGVPAPAILEGRKDLRDGEIILVHNSNGYVTNIEILEVLRSVTGLPAESTVEEVMEVYLPTLTGNYSPPPTQPSLEEYRQQKIAVLDSAYQEALKGDFESQGYTFSYGDEAQRNFTKVTALFGLRPDKVDTPWSTKSHGIILLTRELYLLVVEDAENHEWYNLGKLWSYRHSVEVAQSYDEVDAINWE
jgi:hypothetical protein